MAPGSRNWRLVLGGVVVRAADQGNYWCRCWPVSQGRTWVADGVWSTMRVGGVARSTAAT